jgi:hypothetical protein
MMLPGKSSNMVLKFSPSLQFWLSDKSTAVLAHW